MDDRERVARLIDRVVRDANIEDPRECEELRRELASHFAQAGDSPVSLSAALDRFGDPRAVSDELALVHRRGRFVMHAARIAVAFAASAAVAVAIQIVANLRLDRSANAFEFSHAFARSASFSVMIVVALIAAWELDIESLCARLERQPLRLALVLGTLAMSMLLFHAVETTPLLPSKAVIESGIDVIVWACTIAILARLDRAFAGVFRAAKP